MILSESFFKHVCWFINFSLKILQFILTYTSLTGPQTVSIFPLQSGWEGHGEGHQNTPGRTVQYYLHTNNLFISLSGSSAVGLAVWLDVGSGGMLGWRRVGFWSQIDNKKRRLSRAFICFLSALFRIVLIFKTKFGK